MSMLHPGALIIQRYQIVRLIGRGGMGAVYEAVDRRLRNTVALKQMLGDAPESAEAFEREAQLLAALRHPALPKVIDYFFEGAGRYLVMEFFPGADLAALLARHGNPFSPAEVLGWADQVLIALEYLHTREPPVLHRDIKPQNLKLTAEGQVVLLDFGLAKGIGPGASRSLFGYTLHYAPLEQIQGSGTDARSDLYALAATLYHLLTGRAPASAPARAEALLAGQADPLPPVHTVNRRVPLEVSTILAQALALRREERPGSAAELRQALRAVGAVFGAIPAPDAPTHIAQLPRPGAAVAARPISVGWDHVRAAARAQASQVLRELAGAPHRPGPYAPHLYIPRANAEEHLRAFLTSASGALLLIGDSGTGKTNLLARWAEHLQQQGDAVLFYRCGGSLGAEIDREISRDLGREAPEALAHDLGQIRRLAAEAGRCLVLIFDGLNEYRSGAQAGPESLLKQLDALVGRVAGPALRVVISCNSVAWGQLERAGAANLFWSAYYYGPDGQPWLSLEPFTPDELAMAYQRYAGFYRLQTPLERLPTSVRERLRKPLMLRLIAESCRDGPVELAARGPGLGLFRRYYEERVRQRREHLFMDELAGEMLRRGAISVPIRDLARNEHLREELLREDPDTAYCRLLDNGVLVEQRGHPFAGETVSFAYTELGAYVLARHLLGGAAGSEGLVGAVTGLMARARAFPLAFDVARIALLVARQSAAFATLARSPDIELRELVAQTLVELYAEDPQVGADLLKSLCQQDSDETRRTALKAAYYIGPPARDLFLWAAARGGPALRRVARDALYLIWRSDPDFTYGLLRDLVARVGPSALRDLRNILEFFFDLSVVIYINHPERPDVRDTTVELYYELARQRLHLDILNTGVFGKTIEDLIFQAVATAFSRPILDTMLLAEIVPVERFFEVPHTERAILMRVAPLFDPATPLRDYVSDLETLLREDNVLFNLVGTAQIAIHAFTDIAATAPVVRALFQRLPPIGRLWLLLSFSVLLPNTPHEWTPLVEELTEGLFRAHPDLIYGVTPSLLQQFDILLLPLGLAYGKLGQTMPLIELLLQDGLMREDRRQVERIVAGLAAAGFYYPEPVLRLLGDVAAALRDALPEALAPTLATMRMQHRDAVDVFMARRGFSDALQRHVAAAADTELVRRYIYWLGLYNQVVHSCVYYPKMRRQMAMAAMEMLTRSRTPGEFVTVYTATVFRMLREAGFRLSEWTRDS
ncbi:MAG: serine/threonine-protein kinase [Oscillochloridaceae bacterium]|nr:serine/threonine-protein kinase [Chloroflexaceae bacterium]MDW8392400.1 serine/threonine-protein kinase [Oscillochloridaceae bacterium]